MYAKLILIAEEITFDDQGQLSATNIALDVVRPSYPTTLEKMDLLTLWTRGRGEPAEQLFTLQISVGEQQFPLERIRVDFGDNHEAYVGLSLDGFVIDKPAPYVFHFQQNGEDRGVWIMRTHQLTPKATQPMAEAK